MSDGNGVPLLSSNDAPPPFLTGAPGDGTAGPGGPDERSCKQQGSLAAKMAASSCFSFTLLIQQNVSH